MFVPHSSNSTPERENCASLTKLWARKYIERFGSPSSGGTATDNSQSINTDTNSTSLLTSAAQKATQKLPIVAGQTLLLTHGFLDEVIQRQQIAPEHLNPIQIATDNRSLFQKVLAVAAAGYSPDRLSAKGSRQFGQVRQGYTAQDSRVWGFVVMHIHYTIGALLEQLTPSEQACLEPYFQVMYDHLYMPLQVTYEAAANHSPNSIALKSVQALLPNSTEIARRVLSLVYRQFPGYNTHSGDLRSRLIQQSSLRDVEMFQVYLCLCILEGSVRSVQQELFPLCVMLYPRLGVSWKLVRVMLQGIRSGMRQLMTRELILPALPYLDVMEEIFSRDVFE